MIDNMPYVLVQIESRTDFVPNLVNIVNVILIMRKI